MADSRPKCPPASAWRTATMTPFVTYMQVQKYTTKICELYIRNPEIHEIRSGTKLFITFLSLRFFDMRRERRNFFNKRAAHFVDPNWSRRGETKNQLASARLESQLTAFFFKSSKSSALPGMMSFTSRFYFLSGVFILISLIVTSAPHARAHLHSMCAPI